ncbi:MAG: anti-sigma factor antagonist [Oscillospiraceae bacterium]|jgi:stage II sporulation protein AA (anti-sigma F factor antagonist)|nr:anti-sigma factor antagonist [Oscillospiraceae bacterium]
MGVKLSVEQGVITACIDGEIDHHSARGIRERIDSAVEKTTPKTLNMDFGGVSFMDSSGIGLIMGRYKIMRELGGRVNVINANSTIQRMIKLGGLGRLNIMGDTFAS